ncbi:helix-turn-helix domain-containing protein [Marinobacter similis]
MASRLAREDYTLQEIGELLGLGYSRLSRIENGEGKQI